MANRTCTIEGCERKLIARGLCGMHYARWSKTGSVGSPEQIRPRRADDPRCSVEGCEREHFGRGWCATHYRRWYVHGDPSIVLPHRFQPGNKFNPGPQFKEVVEYEGAHRRVQRSRGMARAHSCDRCGRPAYEWCYDHTDPDERFSAEPPSLGLVYSLKPEHYIPLCRSCHRYFDKEVG